MNSIRLRLLMAVGLVVVTSLAVVGWVTSRVTHDAFFRFLDVEESAHGGIGEVQSPELARALNRLGEFHDTRGDWEGVGPVLLEIFKDADPGEGYLVLDVEGDFVAGSPVTLDEAQVTTDGAGGVHITMSPGGIGGAEDGEVQLMFKGPGLPLNNDAGKRVGSILPIPLPSLEPGPSEREFLGSVNRWLMIAVGVVGVVALGLTAFIAGRILGPIEAVTRAARDMEGGNLSRRVEVSSRDEVGDLAHAFNSMAEGLTRIEELRKKMVSDVAHELRTPLTSVRCQLEAIQDGLVTPDAKAIESIQEEVLSLQHLVEDLQDLALAEAGQLRLQPVPISVKDETESVVRSLRVPGETDRATLVVAMDELPRARADADRFRQVVRNLLVNALQHTPSDGEVRIAGRRENGSIRVDVTDTGPGIPEEHLPYVFERFYRADQARQRRTGGAGLGLAITRQLVEAQGGEIRAESRPGQGATFIFTLPIASQV